MTNQELKEQSIAITLKCIDKQNPAEWITFNDKIHTTIINTSTTNSIVQLLPDELPIIECNLGNSYVLLTTNRIISVVSEQYNELFYEQIEGFSNNYENENHLKINGKYPKIHKIAPIKKNGHEFLFFIDSGHPSWFVRILIQNIRSYKILGKWFLNPKISY